MRDGQNLNSGSRLPVNDQKREPVHHELASPGNLSRPTMWGFGDIFNRANNFVCKLRRDRSATFKVPAEGFFELGCRFLVEIDFSGHDPAGRKSSSEFRSRERPSLFRNPGPKSGAGFPDSRRPRRIRPPTRRGFRSRNQPRLHDPRREARGLSLTILAPLVSCPDHTTIAWRAGMVLPELAGSENATGPSFPAAAPDDNAGRNANRYRTAPNGARDLRG